MGSLSFEDTKAGLHTPCLHRFHVIVSISFHVIEFMITSRSIGTRIRTDLSFPKGEDRCLVGVWHDAVQRQIEPRID